MKLDEHCYAYLDLMTTAYDLQKAADKARKLAGEAIKDKVLRDQAETLASIETLWPLNATFHVVDDTRLLVKSTEFTVLLETLVECETYYYATTLRPDYYLNLDEQAKFVTEVSRDELYLSDDGGHNPVRLREAMTRIIEARNRVGR